MVKKGPDFSRPPVDDDEEEKIVVRRPGRGSIDEHAQGFISGAQQPLVEAPALRIVGGSSPGQSDEDKFSADKTGKDRVGADKTYLDSAPPDKTRQDKTDTYNVAPSASDQIEADAGIVDRNSAGRLAADIFNASKVNADKLNTDRIAEDVTKADKPPVDRASAVKSAAGNKPAGRARADSCSRPSIRRDMADAGSSIPGNPTADKNLADNTITDKPIQTAGISLADWVGESALQAARRRTPEPTGKAETIKVPSAIMSLIDEIHLHRGRSRSSVIVSMFRDGLAGVLPDIEKGVVVELAPVRLTGQDRRSVSVTIPFDIDADLDRVSEALGLERHQIMMRLLIPAAIRIWQHEVQPTKG